MTIRVKPVDRARSGRDPNRRTFYTNLAFGATVVIAVLILVIVGASTWYNAHLAPVATVGGQTITKDQFLDRATVEAFRLQQLASRVNAELAAGRLTAAQASSRIDQINQQLDDKQGTFSATIVEKLIDTNLQTSLANELGVTPTAEQVDARILQDKTRKEERHIWLVAVKPEVTAPATDPTDAQKAAAKTKADGALASIKGGKAFADVAREVSTDASKTSGGDLGFADSSVVDAGAWQAALFKLDVNGLTDVIVGDDGIARIGLVTEIVPAQVDAAWDQKMVDAKVKPEAYRAAIQSEVARSVLGDKVVADAKASGPQRKVQELKISAPAETPGDKAIKVRHILFSPKDDPQGAGELPATDPAWTTAQLAAQKAYDTIKADPSTFDAIARKESDETSATGDDGSGGKLPYYDVTSPLDETFLAKITVDGLKPGDLLPPFKSSFGWHVVQVMYFPPDADEMAKLKAQATTAGTDFSQLVRDFSDGPKSGAGGDIGWVAKGILDDRLTSVILNTPVGALTDVIDVKDDGLYLFKVLEERTAAPDADQLKTIESNAFGNWYSGKKSAVTITRDLLGG